MGTTNILDLNNRVDDLERAISGGDSAQANKKDIATEFSATTNYTAGCFVYHEGKLYQFNADHSAGAWDPTDVVEANVTDQVVSNAAAIAGLTASDVAYDNTDSGLTATNVQGAVDEVNGKVIVPQDINVTKDANYVGVAGVHAIKIGKMVICSGRFEVTTEKPAGQTYSLFTNLPAPPSGTVVPIVARIAGLILSAAGTITSNDAVPVGWYNISLAYISE